MYRRDKVRQRCTEGRRKSAHSSSLKTSDGESEGGGARKGKRIERDLHWHNVNCGHVLMWYGRALPN